MPAIPALLMLTLAAFLEVGGDALVRKGLGTTSAVRGIWLILGMFILFSYGVVVNLPSWNFGRLLGIYVSLFFVVAQIISYVGFQQLPSVPVLVGGSLVVAGGLIISFWPDSATN